MPEKIRKPHRTTQTIEVIQDAVPHPKYRPECNVGKCRWIGVSQSNIVAAQQKCRAHQKEKHSG